MAMILRLARWIEAVRLCSMERLCAMLASCTENEASMPAKSVGLGVDITSLQIGDVVDIEIIAFYYELVCILSIIF